MMNGFLIFLIIINCILGQNTQKSQQINKENCVTSSEKHNRPIQIQFKPNQNSDNRDRCDITSCTRCYRGLCLECNQGYFITNDYYCNQVHSSGYRGDFLSLWISVANLILIVLLHHIWLCISQKQKQKQNLLSSAEEERRINQGLCKLSVFQNHSKQIELIYKNIGCSNQYDYEIIQEMLEAQRKEIIIENQIEQMDQNNKEKNQQGRIPHNEQINSINMNKSYNLSNKVNPEQLNSQIQPEKDNLQQDFEDKMQIQNYNKQFTNNNDNNQNKSQIDGQQQEVSNHARMTNSHEQDLNILKRKDYQAYLDIYQQIVVLQKHQHQCQFTKKEESQQISEINLKQQKIFDFNRYWLTQAGKFSFKYMSSINRINHVITNLVILQLITSSAIYYIHSLSQDNINDNYYSRNSITNDKQYNNSQWFLLLIFLISLGVYWLATLFLALIIFIVHIICCISAEEDTSKNCKQFYIGFIFYLASLIMMFYIFINVYRMSGFEAQIWTLCQLAASTIIIFCDKKSIELAKRHRYKYLQTLVQFRKIDFQSF